MERRSHSDAAVREDTRPLPPPLTCGLCRGRSGEDVREHTIAHGVALPLCTYHRSVGFQRRRSGEDFVDALRRLWTKAGCLTVRRQDALDAHIDRITRAAVPVARERPGSYTWPWLREIAEARFAAGDPPRTVIRELRARFAGGALVPSVKTMHRWYRERRWEETTPEVTDAKARAAAAVARLVRAWRWLDRLPPGDLGFFLMTGHAAPPRYHRLC